MANRHARSAPASPVELAFKFSDDDLAALSASIIERYETPVYEELVQARRSAEPGDEELEALEDLYERLVRFGDLARAREASGDLTARLEGIFDDIDGLFGTYCVFPSVEARHAVVLWAVHTWVVGLIDTTPRLAVVAPESQSGKTRVLDVLELVVNGPEPASHMSEAAIYTLIESEGGLVTIFLDEADTFLSYKTRDNNESLRGLLDAGFQRGKPVKRAQMLPNGDRKIQTFDVFAPVVLAGIGDLPETIMNRAVVIRMRRRAPHEPVAAFRRRRATADTSQLRQRLEQWADEVTSPEYRALIADGHVALPDGVADRAADVWEPLLLVGELAGEQWAGRARRAAVKMIAQAREATEVSLGVLLLRDIRRVFTASKKDRIGSEALVYALEHLEESPWGNVRGRAIDQQFVARILRGYTEPLPDGSERPIKSKTVRYDGRTCKGYTVDQFADAFARYLVDEEDEPADVSHVSFPWLGVTAPAPPLTCDVSDVPDVTPIWEQGGGLTSG